MQAMFFWSVVALLHVVRNHTWGQSTVNKSKMWWHQNRNDLLKESRWDRISGEPEGFRWPTILYKQDKVTGSNWSNAAEQWTEPEGQNQEAVYKPLYFSPCPEIFHASGEGSIQAVWEAFRTLSTTLNNTRGLWQLEWGAEQPALWSSSNRLLDHFCPQQDLKYDCSQARPVCLHFRFQDSDLSSHSQDSNEGE